MPGLLLSIRAAHSQKLARVKNELAVGFTVFAIGGLKVCVTWAALEVALTE